MRTYGMNELAEIAISQAPILSRAISFPVMRPNGDCVPTVGWFAAGKSRKAYSVNGITVCAEPMDESRTASGRLAPPRWMVRVTRVTPDGLETTTAVDGIRTKTQAESGAVAVLNMELAK